MSANPFTVILPHVTGFVTLALKLLIYTSKPGIWGFGLLIIRHYGPNTRFYEHALPGIHGDKYKHAGLQK